MNKMSKMKKNEDIFDEVFKIFIEVFNDRIFISSSTTSNDIQEWSSLKHIQLIDLIEKKFKIKFKLAEVIKLKSVDEICEGIKIKLRLIN